MVVFLCASILEGWLIFLKIMVIKNDKNLSTQRIFFCLKCRKFSSVINNKIYIEILCLLQKKTTFSFTWAFCLSKKFKERKFSTDPFNLLSEKSTERYVDLDWISLSHLLNKHFHLCLCLNFFIINYIFRLQNMILNLKLMTYEACNFLAFFFFMSEIFVHSSTS